MRIVGEIDHPRLKISIFKNDGKFSLKFEANLLEQIYKFRDDERLGSVDDVKRIVDAAFIEKIQTHYCPFIYARRNDKRHVV